jgi:hypothetical protein
VRGTNFCSDALLGAIDAELGLMAATADMEHLRNREGQDRNMTTPIAHCVRCQRPAPAEDDPDFLHWEVLDDVDMVCPECETPEEKQAVDEEDVRLADEVDDLPHNPRSN